MTRKSTILYKYTSVGIAVSNSVVWDYDILKPVILGIVLHPYRCRAIHNAVSTYVCVFSVATTHGDSRSTANCP